MTALSVVTPDAREAELPRIGSDRLLLVCPHPDDETLGAGILLQEASASGAEIHVVYLTNGENNRLPQMAAEGRWPRGEPARARWGEIRRHEALHALRILGVESDPEFWNLPDQGIAKESGTVVARMSDLLRFFRPTMFITPSVRDLHPDHAAAGALCRQALLGIRRQPPPRHLVYIVHGSPHRNEGSVTPGSSTGFRARKVLALECHATQLLLSRDRLFGLAAREERFLSAELDASLHAPKWRGLLRLVNLFSR